VYNWVPGPSAPVFVAGDRIFVADFTNSTGDATLDTAVRDAFEERLSHSKFLRVLRGDELDRAKTEIGIDRTALLNEAEAKRLCDWIECAGFVNGSIAGEETALRLDVRLHHLDTEKPVHALSASAIRDETLVEEVHDMSRALRHFIHEAPEAITATRAPSTKSIAAFQAYAIARKAVDPKAQMGLYTQAVTIDPEYVDGYIGISDTAYAMDMPRKHRWALQQAYLHSEGLPEQTRLWNKIQYEYASRDADSILEDLLAYHRLYPLNEETPGWLAYVYMAFKDDAAAAEPYARQAWNLAHSPASAANLIDSLAGQGKNEDLESFLDTIAEQDFSAGLYASLRVRGAMYLGDVETIEEEALKLASRPPAWQLSNVPWIAIGLLQKGKLQIVENLADQVLPLAVETGSDRIQRKARQFRLWLENRRGRLSEIDPEGVYIPGEFENLTGTLPMLCAEIKAPGVLREALATLEDDWGDVDNSYITHKMKFVRAALHLASDQPAAAVDILEPIGLLSRTGNWRCLLALAYERAGSWAKAAEEYERFLANPGNRWCYCGGTGAGWALNQFRLASVYDRIGDTRFASKWYERFTDEWKDADPDIPELIEARERLAELKGESGPTETAAQ
jgi:hypothetical protein